MMKKIALSSAVAICFVLLAGCGGGGDSATSVATTSLSGTVADDYIVGATVCLDKNNNAVCDIGEPSGITGANGSYTLTGITSGEEGSYPLLVVIPSTGAQDCTSGGVCTAITQGYTMSAPAGRHAFISPLTTLVHNEMIASGVSASTAEATIKTDLGITSVDAFANYMTITGDANYTTAHDKAKLAVQSMQANLSALGNRVSTSDPDATRKALAAFARKAAKSGTAVSDDKATLEAAIAAKKSTQASATQDVEITFDLVNGSTPVVCGTSMTLSNIQFDHTNVVASTPETSQTTTGKLADTRFYVSNVLLVSAQGEKTPLVLTSNNYQDKGVALLNFGYDLTGHGTACNANLNNTKLVGKVAPGTYTGIEFSVGVPVYAADTNMSPLNHTNASDTQVTPTPLQNSQASQSMTWNWAGGRKFMKVEFVPDSGVTKGTGQSPVANTHWNVHLGSTGCTNNPATGAEPNCSNPNRMALKFSSFDASTKKIALDVAALYAKSDLTYMDAVSVGCMSGTTDKDCPAIFEQLGLGFPGDGKNADGKTLYDANGNNTQTIFKVMTK